ncbi:DUF7382 domain-containing protein [Halomicrobium salinisoli]|uniref:DUF7382 domain-containing protein n=1 Tax=Halomicrobium salinisoli TaxID=2878391 RepID=UPI001CF0B670|nr:carboxypeptidase regulatory-like domain-containing protein [Halomicrobium salinisoli]
MNTISGLDAMSVTEVDVDPEPEVIGPEETDVELTVVEPDGSPVADATVVVSGGTATMDGVATAKTDDEGTATVTVDPSLGPNQGDGELSVDVKPPANGGYTDRRGNTAILVVREDAG